MNDGKPSRNKVSFPVSLSVSFLQSNICLSLSSQVEVELRVAVDDQSIVEVDESLIYWHQFEQGQVVFLVRSNAGLEQESWKLFSSIVSYKHQSINHMNTEKKLMFSNLKKCFIIPVVTFGIRKQSKMNLSLL